MKALNMPKSLFTISAKMQPRMLFLVSIVQNSLDTGKKLRCKAKMLLKITPVFCNYQLTCLYAHAWPVGRRYLNSRKTTMLSWFKELNRRRREKYVPHSMRDHIYFFLCMLIFINASDILKDWLGFGSGRNFSDLQNILLSTFWAGGVCVFVVKILLWVEMAVRRFVQR